MTTEENNISLAFKECVCTCGCNKEYKELLNPETPSKYEVRKAHNDKNISIIRLKDNEIFTCGDTIERITPLGESYGKVILYNIQVEKSGFMQLHCYTIDSKGIACIRNESHNMTSADDPNLFNYIKNVTSNKEDSRRTWWDK